MFACLSGSNLMDSHVFTAAPPCHILRHDRVDTINSEPNWRYYQGGPTDAETHVHFCLDIWFPNPNPFFFTGKNPLFDWNNFWFCSLTLQNSKNAAQPPFPCWTVDSSPQKGFLIHALISTDLTEDFKWQFLSTQIQLSLRGSWSIFCLQSGDFLIKC